MENHHFSWVNPLFRLGHFPVRFLYVYQRLVRFKQRIPLSQNISLKTPRHMIESSSSIQFSLNQHRSDVANHSNHNSNNNTNNNNQ